MMNVFKTLPPKEIFTDFISHAIFEKSYYISDYNFYKKIIHNKSLENLIEKLKTYYKPNKCKTYLMREMTYSNYNTILRHLCMGFNFHYVYKIKYNKSQYNIVYYITINN